MMLDFKLTLAYALTIFFYHFFEMNKFLVLQFYLDFNGKLETFLKIANYNKLIKVLDRIKLY